MNQRNFFFFTFLYPIFLPPFYWDTIHIPYNLSIIISNWVLKNRCFQSGMLKTLESPLDNKEIKPVNSKGNQPWIFIGRTDAEAPILCPPDSKSRLIVKHSNSGKDEGQEEKAGSRGWDGWRASLTQRTWVWANSGRQWKTRKSGVLQSMGCRVRHDSATKQWSILEHSH